MKRKLLPRIFITLLGTAFILWGAGRIALGIIGEPEKAVITHIRREGGERTDIRPGRYTYSISYTFTLPDGKEISGFTKQIGDGIYLKADGTSTVQIRYLSSFPYFSALEKDVGVGTGSLVLIVAGCILVILMVYKPHIKYESEQLNTMLKAAECAVTRCNSWSFATSDDKYDAKGLLRIAKARDAENPAYEDSFYVVSPRGAIGFCEDGEEIDWLFLTGSSEDEDLPAAYQTDPQVKFCPKCGDNAVPGARFCGKCGGQLR